MYKLIHYFYYENGKGILYVFDKDGKGERFLYVCAKGFPLRYSNNYVYKIECKKGYISVTSYTADAQITHIQAPYVFSSLFSTNVIKYLTQQFPLDCATTIRYNA